MLIFLVYCVLAKGKCQCFALKETDNTNSNMEHSSYVYNTNMSLLPLNTASSYADFHFVQHLNRTLNFPLIYNKCSKLNLYLILIIRSFSYAEGSEH